ncbi:carbohydrate ABC transporter permease [Streptomyces sp. JJ36]|uniref:carbohydrate ABC transporter permease n=1 Tax=Streptomyces sp. JJ36 TaxID=2736645 RepID=UPI001F3BC695|nr:sugar ABC transporter permease [Streptomyces sp. JJ36]MCF6525760.1 sugar ABC transporter permease [Streptomyces sp. JJ36]
MTLSAPAAERAPHGAAPERAARRTPRREAGRRRAGWAMAAPALTLLGLFLAVPFVLAVVYSFTNRSLDSPLPTTWVGLRNYSRLFTDPEFLRGLLNNTVFAAVVVPVQTALALGLALLLNRPLRGMAFFRSVVFLPVVFPMALVAVVWMLIYAPGPTGVLNAALHTLSFGQWQPHDWLNDPAWAMPAVMLTSLWQGVGFQMVIVLAGLQQIPSELYEAASLDRAGTWQKFRHVTLPGLRNTLVFVGLVTTVLAFRLFDQIYIMTSGGPDDATTTVIYQTVTAAFERQQIAKASAMTVVFFLIVLGLALVQRRALRQGSDPR